MKKRALLIFLMLLPAVLGCGEKDPHYTTYTGVVVEQNSLDPLPGLHVKITDGTNIYSETVTNYAGQFSMDFPHNAALGSLRVSIDGGGLYPSKELDLIYTKKGTYDYGLVFLYNQTDASLYPRIENISWDFPDGDRTVRFKDIVIKSDYSLTEAWVELSPREDFTDAKQYPLEKQENGTYSVRVNEITVGERCYFHVVAFNSIGKVQSKTYSRIFGLPYPLIEGLQSATVNNATVKMRVSEEPLSTLSAGLCWSASHNPTITDSHNPGGTIGDSEVLMSGLDFYTTTYYVRAYARNANGIAYSEELTLPANNPFSLPTFTSKGDTYTYQYLGKGTWYAAYSACKSYVFVFDDWILPSLNVLSDLFNSYYAENKTMLQLPVWSMRNDEYFEEGESETFMLVSNSLIMAPKSSQAHYYAVRKFKQQ